MRRLDTSNRGALSREAPGPWAFLVPFGHPEGHSGAGFEPNSPTTHAADYCIGETRDLRFTYGWTLSPRCSI